MDKRTVLSLVFLFCLVTLGAQTNQKVFPQVEAGVGLGGQFYLNYLESNPMYFVRVGARFPVADNSNLSFISGYERLRRESFIPLLVRYSHGVRNQFYGHFGYAIGFRTDISHLKEYDMDGGVAIGTGYDRSVWKNEKAEVLLSAGYEFRTAVLNFETAGSGADVSSDLEFHFFSLGIKSIF